MWIRGYPTHGPLTLSLWVLQKDIYAVYKVCAIEGITTDTWQREDGERRYKSIYTQQTQGLSEIYHTALDHMTSHMTHHMTCHMDSQITAQLYHQLGTTPSLTDQHRETAPGLPCWSATQPHRSTFQSVTQCLLDKTQTENQE